MSSWTPRVLVIGWDGADWRLLRPLMAQGHLPQLARLLTRAAHGDLMSTVPPITAAAWTSFITGRWPANHGVLSWQLPLNAALERPWINASALPSQTLWSLLSTAGQRLGVLNVPLTYPPPRLNGELIAGMLTPSAASEFTCPPELRQTLLERIPNYALDVELQHTERDTRSLVGIQRFLGEVALALEHRNRALDFLWERGPFDFFMTVYETPDRLQHLLYQFVAGETTDASADWQAVRQAVIDLYARCDAALGVMLDRVGEQTTFILLSDHGFGPLHSVWHINDWLVQAGWLAWAGGASQRRHALRQIIAPFRSWLPQGWLRRGRTAFAPTKLVDWARTAAYSGIPTEEGIWLNVRGREPFGIVSPGAAYEQMRDEIMEAAEAFVDPATGRHPVQRACRREDVHRGPFCARAPDIILVLDEGYKVTPGRADAGLIDNVTAEGIGIHRREGIVALAGPSVTPGRLEGATLPDLLPTILEAAGVHVPDGIDGHSLLNRFDRTQDSGERHTLPLSVEQKLVDFTPEEAALIEARLASLGYLE